MPSTQPEPKGVRAIFKRVAAAWRPLLYAKDNLDDQYNFPRGRMAGQPRPEDSKQDTGPWCGFVR